ncbi:MAG TPA: tRNA (adenosine(37)-N6)-dimethylallyltransferase MiaA [Rectinemataceae bacterium]|nr:tRNA (adenosine(37)-N6)-dimethylallyltransferase MiaA [Rectinemataceae bacterium]
MAFESILVLVGATASGKTAMLEALFGAGGLLEGRAEVVSADSMQSYRGMVIGTAKPGTELLRRIPHHLLDIRNPDEPFSAGDFVQLAGKAIDGILARGRLPIVAGGTGFYIRNLLLGLPAAPPADPALRAAVAADLARLGPSTLRAELTAGDPVSAARIHPNDLYRLTRALEILRASGRPRVDFLPGAGAPGAASPDLPAEGQAANSPVARPWLVVHYRRPREELIRRIAERVDSMLAAGLAEEVAALVSAGYGPEAPGMRAIGYAEFLSLRAEGLSGRALLDAARERIVTDTVQYAKRQETYFRGLIKTLREREAAVEPSAARPDSEPTFEVATMDATDAGADAARLEALIRATHA